MQKLMDNYIAAEEVIRITNPVDILNVKAFEEELERSVLNGQKPMRYDPVNKEHQYEMG